MSLIGKSPLHTMTLISPTEFWNDSCSTTDLAYAIDNGATGGTSNPNIIRAVLKREMDIWRPRIVSLIEEYPTASEVTIGWKIMEEITVNAAKLLKPIYDKSNGRNGRLSMQVNAQNYRNAKDIVEQALYISSLYPNNNIKLPITKAGVEAIEELTYQGVSVNGTLSYSVSQLIALAEAVERGLARREKEGKDTSTMSPVCTMMIGRLDEWLKFQMDKKVFYTDPIYLEWAGLAATKKAYRIYKERGYRTRILIAAFRNLYHWSELIGADISMTMNIDFQKRYNASDVEVKSRIDDPVDPKIIAELEKRFPDFSRAYNENGMKPEEFEYYGPFRQMIHSFIGGYVDLLSVIRHIMISDPDITGE